MDLDQWQLDERFQLPDNLPIPVDDGACSHLLGLQFSSITLAATDGTTVDLSLLSYQQPVVVYCYPRTGRPDEEPSPEWDAIPGARGCTPQSCAFRDHYSEIQHAGGELFGLSLQSTEYQQELVERLHLPFRLLSDADQLLTQALELPTFFAEEMTLLRRLTFVVHRGEIIKVFYPVFPPDQNASTVLQWLQSGEWLQQHQQTI